MKWQRVKTKDRSVGKWEQNDDAFGRENALNKTSTVISVAFFLYGKARVSARIDRSISGGQDTQKKKRTKWPFVREAIQRGNANEEQWRKRNNFVWLCTKLWLWRRRNATNNLIWKSKIELKVNENNEKTRRVRFCSSVNSIYFGSEFDLSCFDTLQLW